VREAAAAAVVLRAPYWSALPGEAEWDSPPHDQTSASLPCLERLEHELARAHNRRFGVAVASGTTALTIALSALDLVPGDEVLVPAYGCIAPEMAVLGAGGVPIHVEIDPDTYALDPAAVSRARNERTRAVIAVHFAGRPMDVAVVAAAAPELAVVEDACLAEGAARAGQPVGSVGRAAVFSFGVDKPLHAGEGGLVVTDDAALAARLRRLRSLGLDPETGDHQTPAGNHRMTELQAAVLLPQWERAARDRARRERSARTIEAALAGCPLLRPLAGGNECAPIGPRSEGAVPARCQPLVDARAQLWLRYDENAAEVDRRRFVAAVQAEGIPLFAGWTRPNYICALFATDRAARWLAERGASRPPDHYERTVCPVAERAAYGEACLLPLRVLSAPGGDVADAARALVKVLEQLPTLRASRRNGSRSSAGSRPSPRR
jgi:dTDP-4-amino-4,6-dideoxygalactose transaminase